MRRRLFILLVPVLLLAGCWSRVEVNDLAIVSLIALDRSPEGEIKLWLHVVVPAHATRSAAGGGSSAGTGTGLPFITLAGTGSTVLEAAHRVQTQLPRRIFWAHARVVLIGETLAREGSRAVVDFLTRHRELRLTNYVLVVRGDLARLLSTQVNMELLPAESFREIERLQIAPVATLRDWGQALGSRGEDPLLGVAEVVPPPEGAPYGQRPSVRVQGGALFKDDKLVAFVPYPVARGLLWLRSNLPRGVVTVAVPGTPGNVSVEWLATRIQRTVRRENGKVTVSVELTAEGDVSESQAMLDLSDPSQLRRIEKALNQEIRRRMEAALATMKELGVDAVGFGELIHQQQPQAWQRLEKDWPGTAFKKLRVVLHVDARVRRTGLSSKPVGVGEQSLIKGRQ